MDFIEEINVQSLDEGIGNQACADNAKRDGENSAEVLRKARDEIIARDGACQKRALHEDMEDDGGKEDGEEGYPQKDKETTV